MNGLRLPWRRRWRRCGAAPHSHGILFVPVAQGRQAIRGSPTAEARTSAAAHPPGRQALTPAWAVTVSTVPQLLPATKYRCFAELPRLRRAAATFGSTWLTRRRFSVPFCLSGARLQVGVQAGSGTPSCSRCPCGVAPSARPFHPSAMVIHRRTLKESRCSLMRPSRKRNWASTVL
jgi:hypothetical protein